MPFCTSCGAEVAADKKFCEQCGAPMGPDTAPAAPEVPGAPENTVNLPPVYINPRHPKQKTPQTPKSPLIIGGILIVFVILAAVYFIGIPMLKVNQDTSNAIISTHTPAVTPTQVKTVLPTPVSTPVIEMTTVQSVEIRDDRLEEDYELVYTLNQKFAFGQKVNVAQELTRPPLYVKFNLTPTKIIRHRLVSIGTNNEHYENTTETSPYAWFEVKVFDASSGTIVNQQGFGNDYPDLTQQKFMVRTPGNYRIEMSGNEVNAEVEILTGTS
ncbi:MAG: zinc-ribbon domain-containing protein [Methanoregula sp.]|nr:zinc-ribbon domain-containing protein [Methanoregula sp.]